MLNGCSKQPWLLGLGCLGGEASDGRCDETAMINKPVDACPANRLLLLCLYWLYRLGFPHTGTKYKWWAEHRPCQANKRGILGTDSKGHPGEETRQEDVRGRELRVSPSFYKVVVECLVMLPESSIQEAQSKARAKCFVTEALMVWLIPWLAGAGCLPSGMKLVKGPGIYCADLFYVWQLY